VLTVEVYEAITHDLFFFLFGLTSLKPQVILMIVIPHCNRLAATGRSFPGVLIF